MRTFNKFRCHHILVFCLSLSCAALCPHAGFADEVVVDTGDRLTGTVVKMVEKILTLKTAYSEPVKIKKKQVTAISTDTPVSVHLRSGGMLNGRLVTDESGRLLVKPGVEREAVVVFWKAIKSINPPPSKWSGNLTIGGNRQSGNTNRSSSSMGAEGTRKTEKDRINLRFLINSAEEDDTLTARNRYGSLKYDYFVSRKTFTYLGIEMLSDDFKNLNLRTVVGPGIGYQFWDSPAVSLLLEFGITYFAEDYDLLPDADGQWISGRASIGLTVKLTSFLAFDEKIIYYQNLEEGNDYQVRNEASLKSVLGSGWSLKLTNIFERNSMPPATSTTEKNDSQWIMALQYTF